MNNSSGVIPSLEEIRDAAIRVGGAGLLIHYPIQNGTGEELFEAAMRSASLVYNETGLTSIVGATVSPRSNKAEGVWQVNMSIRPLREGTENGYDQYYQDIEDALAVGVLIAVEVTESFTTDDVLRLLMLRSKIGALGVGTPNLVVANNMSGNELPAFGTVVMKVVDTGKEVIVA